MGVVVVEAGGGGAGLTGGLTLGGVVGDDA